MKIYFMPAFILPSLKSAMIKEEMPEIMTTHIFEKKIKSAGFNLFPKLIESTP